VISVECWKLLRVEAVNGVVLFAAVVEADHALKMEYATWNRIGRPDELTIINERAVVDVPDDDDRYAACIANWPDCVDGAYDPRCCRFPKSCSCWKG
jgi:hypothetical protein